MIEWTARERLEFVMRTRHLDDTAENPRNGEDLK
jgi:hypothetical protein